VNTQARNIIPWSLLAGSAALCLYTPFSLWAINAAILGKHNFGLALFFSFTFPMAIYTAGAITIISGVLAVFYRNPDKRGRHILLSAAAAGAFPFLYVWMLDALSTPA